MPGLSPRERGNRVGLDVRAKELPMLLRAGAGDGDGLLLRAGAR
jgi:hypothetical protein